VVFRASISREDRGKAWPDETFKPAGKVETAYHKADHAIQKIVDLLAA
jgi:hypothetical protein